MEISMRAWEEFLLQQENELGKDIVNKWLKPLKVIRFDACNLYLEASDSFKALWFEEHMRHIVQSRLCNNNRKQIKVHVSIAAQDKEPYKKRKRPIERDVVQPFSLKFDDIDPNATFENFVTSSGNLLGYKLLEESSVGFDALSFNPIYLYGRSGTGKTHLMMSMADKLNKLGKVALYVRADTFTEHVVNAIRSGEMQLFRKMYRHVDALLIDDLEIFSRKGATQEEFFHTFNTLHVEGKQIVLSAKCPPGELKYIEPRLTSRFEWGIVIPLLGLEKESMEKILVQKAAKSNLYLSDELKNFLLEVFGNSTKTLIRAVDSLVLRTHLNQGLGIVDKQLSLAKAKNYLADLIQEEERSVLTAGKIIRGVAEYYGIKIDDILSKSQARESALPRQIAMHLCRHQLNLPFMKIGDIFARDHSTVMASVKQIQKSLETKNSEISDSVKNVLKLLESKP